MSIWSRIRDALSALAQGEGLAAVFDRLGGAPEKSVGFTIAVIALGAKMAKADGQVTRNEVTAFREVFEIPEGQEDAAARVFNLARRDVAGFEEYAARVARMFGGPNPALSDLVEGLFHIAMADGQYHTREEAFLARVGEILGLPPAEFRAIRARYVAGDEPDPRAVLGLGAEASVDEARAAWRRLVRESHPDRMAARGVPEEAVRMAEKRLIAVNAAWEEIARERA
ncbi:molecular chaperone DjiA [Mesobaculum littorinae]|uniref:Molecular chaperone DjiA n=1 Tax=Mesobaculum littorinae TaxID=2486419 RepID=A0A438AN02_9RHOB|nr:molecular chaperone DjiA [Mesobaculum littorinae]RVV99990.1 molecular chaperone DjiA [Mesobaculum littorinae]